MSAYKVLAERSWGAGMSRYFWMGPYRSERDALVAASGLVADHRHLVRAAEVWRGSDLVSAYGRRMSARDRNPHMDHEQQMTPNATEEAPR